MASNEYNIETLVMAILAANATLSAATIVHHVEDDSTVSKGNRITVKADPATPKLIASRPDKTAPVLQSIVTVSVQSDASETTFDNWRAAIDAAMNPTSFSGSLVTTATGLFPNGIVIETANGGDLFDGPSGRRTLTRTFPVVFQS